MVAVPSRNFMDAGNEGSRQPGRPGIKPLGLSPAEAMRWFYVDTIVHSAPVTRLLLETVGEDHLLLGSDWPFPMGTECAGDDIGLLDESLQLKIRVANPDAVFSS